MLSFFKFIHVLSVVIWIGGMFFAYMVLRPTAVEVLQAPERLKLWNGVFRRFFNWVWSAIGALLLTGLYMIYLYGGLPHVPHYIHAMLALGLVMVGVYVYVFFQCYVPLSLHVAKERWKEAGDILGRIRQLVGFNLALGATTIAVIMLSR